MQQLTRPGSLPDFVLVGAMKAGTTSLIAWLGAHPQIFVPQQKELHFFDAFWSRGVDWYRSMFAQAPEGSVVGEGTPSYMVVEQYVERMATVIPDALLLVVLRNPVDRAWSQYRHSVSREEERRTFARVVEDGIADDPDDWRTRGGVLARGRYIEQLRHLTRFYDRARIHVGLFDDLVDEPDEFYASVCRFLGVDHRVLPDVVGTVFDPYDIDPVIRRRAAASERREPSWKQGATRVFAPIRRRGRIATAPEERMSPATRAALIDYFRPYNEELAGHLGVDLSRWNT